MEAGYIMVLLVSSQDCNLVGKECAVSVARPFFILICGGIKGSGYTRIHWFGELMKDLFLNSKLHIIDLI